MPLCGAANPGRSRLSGGFCAHRAKAASKGSRRQDCLPPTSLQARFS